MRTEAQRDSKPWRRTTSRISGAARSRAATIEKRSPSAIAIAIAASAIPTTGAGDSSRAASRPGSPKQAIATPAIAGSAARAATASSVAAAASASSACDSTEGVPHGAVTASISVPGRARRRASAAIAAVIATVVLGLTTSSRIAAQTSTQSRFRYRPRPGFDTTAPSRTTTSPRESTVRGAPRTVQPS